jgi:hypothetical protein
VNEVNRWGLERLERLEMRGEKIIMTRVTC